MKYVETGSRALDRAMVRAKDALFNKLNESDFSSAEQVGEEAAARLMVELRSEENGKKVVLAIARKEMPLYLAAKMRLIETFPYPQCRVSEAVDRLADDEIKLPGFKAAYKRKKRS